MLKVIKKITIKQKHNNYISRSNNPHSHSITPLNYDANIIKHVQPPLRITIDEVTLLYSLTVFPSSLSLIYFGNTTLTLINSLTLVFKNKSSLSCFYCSFRLNLELLLLVSSIHLLKSCPCQQQEAFWGICLFIAYE